MTMTRRTLLRSNLYAPATEAEVEAEPAVEVGMVIAGDSPVPADETIPADARIPAITPARAASQVNPSTGPQVAPTGTTLQTAAEEEAHPMLVPTPPPDPFKEVSTSRDR